MRRPGCRGGRGGSPGSPNFRNARKRGLRSDRPEGRMSVQHPPRGVDGRTAPGPGEAKMRMFLGRPDRLQSGTDRVRNGHDCSTSRRGSASGPDRPAEGTGGASCNAGLCDWPASPDPTRGRSLEHPAERSRRGEVGVCSRADPGRVKVGIPTFDCPADRPGWTAPQPLRSPTGPRSGSRAGGRRGEGREPNPAVPGAFGRPRRELGS